MIHTSLNGKRLILASQSPRRQLLLKDLGMEFETMDPNVDEVYPAGLNPVQIAIYLAELKAAIFDKKLLDEKTIVITADTIVSLGDEILGKPSDSKEAVVMLQKLSGRKHDVITAVCLKSKNKQIVFHTLSSVYFKILSREEIDYYVVNFQPFDKAGGYGIQEWIGYIGINRIEGSFFNVMGLPVKELYEQLLEF
jgi:septum formation protein